MIIGLTGPLCAGTDSFAEILKKEHGFDFFSYSDILREEARRRGIEITRINLQDLGDELRKKDGGGVLSKKIIDKILSSENKNFVVGNIRNPSEVKVLRNYFGEEFLLVKLDAPREIRFERLQKRGREKDPQTFEEFLKIEERDMGLNENSYGQKHAEVFLLADKLIENSGSLGELAKKAEELLRSRGK